MNDLIVPVRNLNEYVNRRISGDAFLTDIWVEGEADEIATRPPDTAYFVLKDAAARVQCVTFRFRSNGLLDVVRRGARVIVRGRIGLYVKAGRFGVTVEEARAAGQGEQLAQLMQLQQKLAAEGMFAVERKRALPLYPTEIAIVTSADGAARRDIETIAARRNPGVRLRLYPVTVQGDEAADSIATALAHVNEDNTADVVIVARGGGSAADLAAFNDERVVRAVASSLMPVISAVGHETDVTLCDMAADIRVSTPSAAAETAVPEAAAIYTAIQQLMATMQSSVRGVLKREYDSVNSETTNLRLTGIDRRIVASSNAVERYSRQQVNTIRSVLAAREAELLAEEQTLAALNPSRILQSGYAVVLKQGRRVLGVHDIQPGDHLKLMFSDGSAEVTVAADGGRQGLEDA